jgi:hypothetical protein
MKSNSHKNSICNTAEESRRLLEFYGSDRFGMISLLERQLGVLHMRAQVVIGFAAVGVTTTGFSGRLIAGTNVYAQVSIIAGLAIILLGCLYLFLRALSVDWVISRSLGGDTGQTVESILNHRNRKTCAYRRGSAVVLFGFLIYALSIAIMLLNPEPLNIPVR